MQIESILIFVVLIALSSLLNKKKQGQQQRRNQQKTMTSQQQEQKSTPNSPVGKTAAPSKKRSLQDIFREMQSELEAEYKKTTGEQESDQYEVKPAPIKKSDSADKKVSATKDKKKRMKPPEPTEKTKQNSPIYSYEIKDEIPFKSLKINQDTVFNGIIFSEILGKPKGKR